MKKEILCNCLWVAKLLLCLFVFCCSSCSHLRHLAYKADETSRQILRVAVSGSDFPLFMQRIQESKLVPMDLQKKYAKSQYMEFEEFWVTFCFVTRNAFLVGRWEIISTGMVIRIN
ncbi:hypothetical protein [Pedobacter frigiditerrae]|uniref:hypothetical protein n=1 Tax=Pedobacter frigiditerrae TaxID=2530452 RepID=UPI002930F701|nr:hypothetical protein [Pedobacter frigiditerrae]